LKKILPPAVPLLKADGRIVALIKPQFEAGKAEVDKGRVSSRTPRCTGASWRNCKNLFRHRLAFAGAVWLNPPCSALPATKNSWR